MGIDNGAFLYFGVKFTFDEVKHLIDNLIDKSEYNSDNSDNSDNSESESEDESETSGSYDEMVHKQWNRMYEYLMSEDNIIIDTYNECYVDIHLDDKKGLIDNFSGMWWETFGAAACRYLCEDSDYQTYLLGIELKNEITLDELNKVCVDTIKENIHDICKKYAFPLHEPKILCVPHVS